MKKTQINIVIAYLLAVYFKKIYYTCRQIDKTI